MTDVTPVRMTGVTPVTKTKSSRQINNCSIGK